LGPFRAVATGLDRQLSPGKTLLREKGTLIWGRLSISLMKDPAGLTPFVLAIVVDICEKKRGRRKAAAI